MRVSGSILLSTVSNFLDYFKLEAGKQLDVVRAPVDLPSLVGDVQRIIEAMVSNTGDVRLLPPDMALAPAFVLGDPARVCGVLLNLYMNAAKFTRKGAIGMKVHVVRSDYKPSPPTTAVVDVSPSDGSVVDSAWNYSADADAARSGSRSGSGSDGDGDAEGSNGPDSCDGDACAAPGDGGFGYSGSEHDSVQSMVKRHRVGRKMGAQPVPPPYEDTIPRSPGSVRMLVQDEGDGWLSTCSETVPRASCDGRMSISGPAEEVWVCFEVRDSGVGVPPKSLHALFHDYVQGDAADMEQPRTRSGTGLGLAICSKQVAVLGGSIGAVSKPDAGSIFWFKLPMLLVPPEEEAYAGSALAAAAPSLDVKRAIGGGMQPAATDDAGAGAAQQFDTSLENRWQAAPAPDSGIGATTTAPAAPATLPPLGTATGGGASGVAGLRVLVAEDNLINRKVACRVLQSLSVQYEVASNGREAVEAVKAAEASGTVLDAVFMDVCMPEMGGVEATRCIRAMGSTVPFIAMTANAMDKDRDECLAAGMNAFLSKPVLREQLVKCLVATCQGKEPTGSQL